MRTKADLENENKLLRMRIEELEDKGHTVTLPKPGQSVEIVFEPGEVLGKLTIGEETCDVYVGSVVAQQQLEFFSPVGMIKRKFTLIEI